MVLEVEGTPQKKHASTHIHTKYNDMESEGLEPPCEV